ncbi:notum [Acrasis kona]|uniref:Notum n=1 Tax=Acrasis kona TaxID=1008807 RepID=A0AAW2ZMJ4_9EUKA
MLDWLTKHARLKKASEVVVSGGSAGGIATFLHSGFIADYLQGVRVVSAPDAGFLPVDQNSAVAKSLNWLVENMNISGTSDYLKECISKSPKNKLWQCMSGTYLYSKMKMPTFISNSALDSWQLTNIAGLGKECIKTPSKCMSKLTDWQKHFMNVLNNTLGSNPNSYNGINGGYNPSCIQHEQLQNGHVYSKQEIKGHTLRDTFGSWFHNDKKVPRWNIDVPYPNNPSCK